MQPSPEPVRQNPRRRPDLTININRLGPVGSARDLATNTATFRKRPPISLVKAILADTRARNAETFLDSATPSKVMSKKENEGSERPQPNFGDSHDLALSPRIVTRDSLVTNMLLSLDQFSMGQMDTLCQDGPRQDCDEQVGFIAHGKEQGRTSTFKSRSGRGNGHGYSNSSDLEGADDLNRGSSQPFRARRSNSSSGFQLNHSRINSMREPPAHHQRNGPGTPRLVDSRSAKESKSSSANSIDAGCVQVLSSQRWAPVVAHSASEHDTTRTVTGTSQRSTQPPTWTPWNCDFSSSFEDDYDAAPTPTVPVGRRRLTTAPSMPALLPSEPRHEPKLSARRSPSVEFRRSTHSSRSATVGRRSDAKTMDSRDIPPVPAAFELDSAPAPHVSYQKTKETVHATATPASQPVKEKPGFFRRIFGSARNNLISVSSDISHTSFHSNPVSSSSIARSRSYPSNGQSTSPPIPREPQRSAAYTLQKKTSSFFRRRKQSVTEPEIQPLTVVAPSDPGTPSIVPLVAISPVQTPGGKSGTMSACPNSSPITSLRRAMDPYLHSSPITHGVLSPASCGLDSATPTQSSTGPIIFTPSSNNPSTVCSQVPEPQGHRRNVRGFSPDYDPSPKAVIRSVEPEPEEAPHVTMPTSLEKTSSSFLADSSDSDESPSRSPVMARAVSQERMLRLGGLGFDPRLRSSSRSVARAKSSPNLRHLRTDVEIPNKLAEILSRNEHRDSNHSAHLALPIEGILADGSETRLNPACKVSPPSVKMESANTNQGHHSKLIDEPDFVIGGDPTEDDRRKAQKIFDGNEDFIQREKAAAWMGEEGPVRQRTLRAYMSLYDFKNQSILASIRQLCSRLVLKAETQQIDRLLVAFSAQWCKCNPNHGFKAADTIHTICYSIMLLNTDLHMADVEQKMSKGQFVKNTMTTIRQALEESAPDAFARPSILPGKGSLALEAGGRASPEERPPSLSFRTSLKSFPRPESALESVLDQSDGDTCGPLVKAPFDGTLRAWEAQIEVVLKDIYSSIRDERLPLFGAEPAPPPTTFGGLLVMSMLKRTPSVLSKAPSESAFSCRGRIQDVNRANASRWNSKSRSRPRAFGSTGFSSSRTSFEDNSVWSPSGSTTTWSRVSLGRTHTSMSMDSFNSSCPRGDFHPSVGFTNALSHAIIREDHPAPSIASDDIKPTALLDDESLELEGPPWVKEGIVTHKHHMEAAEKKAKDRAWTEVFAVIQKGQLSLFSFSPYKSFRNKGWSRHAGGTLRKGAVVGGGNWQDNATSLGAFNLRQTHALVLPHGSNRSRPHVWALEFPTGAVHLFQVGTPEIGREFVYTSNYWAARLSTHPLIGGVSNMEFGWSDAIIKNALASTTNDAGINTPRPGTGRSASVKVHSRPNSAANAAAMMMGPRRVSLHSRGGSNGLRSASVDHGRPESSSSGTPGYCSGIPSLPRHGKLPGDLIHIAEWTPPQHSMRSGNSDERIQLESLVAYVRSIEEQLQAHNGLRGMMLLAFTPRGPNAVKAMANWQRKSEYLLRESVKYKTYVDCLQAAAGRKVDIYRERDTARRAAMGEEVESLGGDD